MLLRNLFLDDRFDIQTFSVGCLCSIIFHKPLSTILIDSINKNGRMWGRKPPYISIGRFLNVNDDVAMKLHEGYHKDCFTLIYSKKFDEFFLFDGDDMVDCMKRIDKLYYALKDRVKNQKVVLEYESCKWYLVSLRA